jgi:hypothetical protein
MVGATPVGTYYRPDRFVALFEGPKHLDDLWLTRLEYPRGDDGLAVESLAAITHVVDPDYVRALLAAAELRESCRLTYQSMTSTGASERIVCPHAVVKASGRYHVRAFDFARKRFIDFSLSRVLSAAPLPDSPPVPASLDDDWHALVEVEFVPHPRLSTSQRTTVAREYGMKTGALAKTVRRAMLFYLLDEMRLLKAVTQRDANLADVPIWVNNFDLIADELASMRTEN